MPIKVLITFLLQLRLSSRNLFRQRRRTVLALSTVAGGVIALLLAGGFFNWVLVSIREATILSQLGHLQITRPGYFEEGISSPYDYLLPAKIPAEPEALEGVRTIAPRLAFTGLISKGDQTISFLGEGIDPVKEAPIAAAITITKGKDLTDAPPQSLIIGQGLAANLGVDIGDSVVLLASTASGGLNAVELKVAGFFATVSKAYDDSSLRVPVDIARNLVRIKGATSWVVLLSDTARTDASMAAMRTLLPAKDFEITPWYQLADFYNKTVELFSKQVGVIRALIALIVILSISNTLSMAVMERTHEIGTSMAIGVRRRGILMLFLTEGALLGVLGGLIGVVLGLALGELISFIGIPMPPPPGMAFGYMGQIRISPGLTLDGFMLAFTTTLLASIVPAWKASRMNIVDALRNQK